MAAVPRCSLCKVTQLVESKFKNNKQPFLVYSVFMVLSIEIITNIINYFYIPAQREYDFYADFCYPLFTQLGFFLVFASLFLWRERLHFCLRKASATMYLSAYYLFGFLAVLFCFSANLYFQVINTTLICLSMLLFLQSLYAKK